MEATASIIAILQLCDKLIKYGNGVKGAKGDWSRLRDQIRGCSHVLLQLNDQVEDAEEGQSWSGTMAALSTPLERLRQALVAAATKLQMSDTKTGILKWPFQEKEVQKLVAAIESEKGLLSLALQNNSARLLQQIDVTSRTCEAHLEDLLALFASHTSNLDSDLAHIKSALSTAESSHVQLHVGMDTIQQHQTVQAALEDRRKILEWLSPVDHAAQQHDKISRRQPGTCNWFLECDAYRNWCSTPGQTLFCSGIPGAGKTVLTSIIVADLFESFHKGTDIAVAFVYCDYRIRDRQTLYDILLSILKQLGESRTTLSDSMQALYKRAGNGQRRPLPEDIVQALQLEVALLPKTFVLIDALDECPEGARMFLELSKALEGLTVNFLATSRFIPDIVAVFKAAEIVEIRADDHDVEKYVEAHMHRLPKCVQSNSALQDEVKTKIVQAVEGMFLLAYLHLDSLIGKRSAKAVRTALGNLLIGSGAYDSAYTAAMHRIESQVPDQADLGRQAITWITHARRQLTTLELQEALGVEVGQPGLDQDNLSDVDDIISACAGLVTLDAETDVLRLVHYTTQEYFDRTRQEWFSDAEATLTVTCITYLSFDAYGEGRGPLKSASDHVQNPQSSLYEYAARYWGNHAKTAPSTLENVVGFLRRSIHVTTAAEALAKNDTWSNEFVLGPPTSGLHMSAYFGLEAVALAILEKHPKPDVTNSNDSTPLMFAAFHGHQFMVILLLSWNARVGRTNTLEYTALYMAVCGTHEPIIRILLAHHAPTDITPYSLDGALESALDVAIKSGSETTVKLLVEAGADANLKSRGSTPLHVACKGGHEAITKLLVDAGADISSLSHGKITPLFIACLRADESIARMLVEAGANVNHWTESAWGDYHGRNPLFCACTSSSNTERREAVVKLLLDAGADTTRTNDAGKTVLQICVERARKGKKGYDGLVELFRGHGALIEPRGPEDSSGRPLSPQALPLRIQDAK